MTQKSAPARTRSLCGTARREKLAAAAGKARTRCRHPSMWLCQGSSDCARRMESQRR